MEENFSPTLTTSGGDNLMSVVYCAAAIEGNGFRPSHKGDGINDGNVMYTLNSVEHHMVTVKEKEKDMEERMIVRRLTPTECGRLQGYPEKLDKHGNTVAWLDIGEKQGLFGSKVWYDTNGKKHKECDSAKYKALGNSIGLAWWSLLCRRISATYKDRKPTMCSLFDGIGGFPLCWQAINGDGTALWASEIEEFCIAVTKKRFGDGETKGDWMSFMNIKEDKTL